MKILITGIAGFIGTHLAEHFLANTGAEIYGIDKLTYASNGYNRLRDIGCMDNKRVHLYCADLVQPVSPGLNQELGKIDYIFHLAAETHVDNSIKDPSPFVLSNVLGTMHILDYARTLPDLKRFFYFSTDEVFGPTQDPAGFREWDRYNSTNPYAASKAGAEQLALSYSNTYRIPLIITRTMNCFGERQHPEKFIPSTIKKILQGETVLIHSDHSRTIPGSRCYIHCRNVAAALLFLLNYEFPSVRDIVHIVGEQEVNNYVLAKFIAAVVGKELQYELIDFHSTRPGHDLRYGLCGERMKFLGWQLPKTFEDSLTKTINWYVDNPKWLEW